MDIRNATALVQVITGVVESSSSGQLGHYIRHFKFGSYVSNVSDATLLLLMIHLPYLEQLKIARGNRITNASLRYVPRHCPISGRSRWKTVGSRIKPWYRSINSPRLHWKTALGYRLTSLPLYTGVLWKPSTSLFPLSMIMIVDVAPML
ncbi:unnamed protein product [Absidia cylindrospora]